MNKSTTLNQNLKCLNCVKHLTFFNPSQQLTEDFIQSFLFRRNITVKGIIKNYGKKKLMEVTILTSKN